MPFKNPEDKRAYQQAYRERNRKLLAEKQLTRQRAAKAADHDAYCAASREKSKAWRNANLEKSRAESRDRSRQQREKVKHTEEYKLENRARVKRWKEENRGKWREMVRARRAERYASDIQFKLAVSLRRRLYGAVKNNHRSGMAVRELGCSISELKAHLERQFSPGMTWENWGPTGWHIDHARPLYSFDLSDAEQVKLACHYTNLQPLWWHENVRKDARPGKPRPADWPKNFAQARAQVLV